MLLTNMGALTTAACAEWAEVVGRIRGGDQGGVEALYATLCNGHARWFRSIDPQSTEDRLHEILLIVLKAIRSGDLRNPDRLMEFVRTVARRQVAAHIRDAASHRRRFVTEGEKNLRAPEDQSPEACTAQRERLDGVIKILGRLKARDREILKRFYLDEQGQTQICGEMCLTGTQFRLYKSRAIARCFLFAQSAQNGGVLRTFQSTKPF
jgi:RNA polymerase sigma-70 factor (ECF subfamily)